MSRILFTDEQIEELSKNKWIRHISKRGITYTNDFKMKVVKEVDNETKFAKDVFRECGIDPKIVGKSRIESSTHRWKAQYSKLGYVDDTRKGHSGRPRLPEEERIRRAELRKEKRKLLNKAKRAKNK